jgi:hypothetical protein
MTPFLLSALLSLPQTPAAQAPVAPTAPVPSTFTVLTRPFTWQDPITLDTSFDGVQVHSIQFDQARIEPAFFDFTGAPELATRVRIRISNVSTVIRYVHLAVVVEGPEGRLVGTVTTPRKGEKFYPQEKREVELRFTLMKAEVAKGQRFQLVLEPRYE